MSGPEYRLAVARPSRGGQIVGLEARPLRALDRGRVRVRLLSASVGATDLAAARGHYILERGRSMTPGYDMVGEIVEVGDGLDAMAGRALRPGLRVAACLSRMGTHAEYLDLPPWRLVAVPDALDAVVAAALPLDVLTAMSLVSRHAAVRSQQRVLVRGASGAVGRLVVQRAVHAGAMVWGLASPNGRAELEAQGAHWVDRTQADVHAALAAEVPSGFDLVLDHHCGSDLLAWLDHREPRRGRYVASAFAQRSGHEFRDAVAGAVRLQGRRLGRAGSRIALCSVPWEIYRDRRWYRETLATAFDDLAHGTLDVRVGTVLPFSAIGEAYDAVRAGSPGGKVVIVADA